MKYLSLSPMKLSSLICSVLVLVCSSILPIDTVNADESGLPSNKGFSYFGPPLRGASLLGHDGTDLFFRCFPGSPGSSETAELTIDLRIPLPTPFAEVQAVKVTLRAGDKRLVIPMVRVAGLGDAPSARWSVAERALWSSVIKMKPAADWRWTASNRTDHDRVRAVVAGLSTAPTLTLFVDATGDPAIGVDILQQSTWIMAQGVRLFEEGVLACIM